MKPHIRKAFDGLAAARPASGNRPESEAEWVKLQQAQQELGYAMLRELGYPHAEAHGLSHVIWGGVGGRMILELAFSEDDHA